MFPASAAFEFPNAAKSAFGLLSDRGGVYTPHAITDGGGIVSARHQRGDGGEPRALAAFVKRPQAARSNRRYFYSIKDISDGVNCK
jgi:hypothetical protein